MYEWQKQIQIIVDEIDSCIKSYQDEALTLRTLSQKLGYSEYYTTRKFKEISGMKLREYLRQRKLAFALKEIRDSEKSILKIALDYGFSSHEAFTRAFKAAYGRTPSAYRKQPSPVVLRTKINPFDRYLLGLDELGEINSAKAVKTYFVTIPAHKFLFIENRESNGYWDFWQKQNQIPGQDMDTVCGLLDSIKGKLVAGVTSTAEAVRLWPIAMIETADCVTGDTCGQSVMVFVFLFIIPEMCHMICSCLILRKQSILYLNTDHLIMSRRIEVLSIEWRMQ